MSFESLLELAGASVIDGDLDARYDGTRQLDTLGLSIPPSTRVLEIASNWPSLTVDTMAEVLVVEGFECAAEGTDDFLKRIWSAWKTCGMGTLSHLAIVEALLQGSAYLLVGVNEQGKVRTTVRSRDGVAVEQSDGDVTAAVVRYQVTTEQGSEVSRAAYYTPDSIEVFQEVSGSWGRVSSQRAPGFVPVVPLVNKSRITDVNGRSELALVNGYSDAAARAFTLLQLAMEILSMPQRYIAGGDLSKFKKPDGSMPSLADIYLGSLLFAPSSDAKMGQFPGADLTQIINTIKALAQQVSASTGIPLSMLGFTSEGNPMSAEAMRAAKERFISRGEQKQSVFSDAFTQWGRVVLAYEGESRQTIEDKLGSLDTLWRDIAFPSVASKNQAILQGHSQGLISARTAREHLPLTPQQQQRENILDREADDVAAREDGKAQLFGDVPKLVEDDAATPGNEDKAALAGDL